MVASTSISAIQQRLIARLERLPEYIRLTPLNGNKQPQGKEWQNRPFTPTQMIDAVRNGVEVPFENKSGEIYHKRIYPKGFGLLTGPVSGGILALDFDGASALEKFIELNGGLPPITEGFTSRQNWEGEYPDHFQLPFSVPQEFWGSMKNKITIPTKWDTSGKVIERLELRWSNMQSVLPPSIHPETGGFRDLPSRAFGEIERAPAPMWVIEQMLNNSGETEAPVLNKQPHTQEHWTDIKWALSYLNALSPSRADNYDDWISVGMALHSLNDDTLLLEWDDWSKFSSKYRVGECQKKWKSFKCSGVAIAIGTLAHMAKQDGWRSALRSSASLSPFDQPTGTSFSDGIGSGGESRRGNGGDGGSSGGGKNGSGRGGDPDERLRLEIAVYMKETDIIRKKRLRGEICSTYRLSKQDIREIEQELERSQTKPRKRSYNFEEFLNKETEALRWIIPGLLPAGETILLAAQAKCGKTALVTDIIHAVLAGDVAIGEQVGVKGRVLFVTSDESENTTRRRIRARGIDLVSECHNLRFMPYLDINKLGELEAELEDFRPQLVVLDSLTTITDELGISEKTQNLLGTSTN